MTDREKRGPTVVVYTELRERPRGVENSGGWKTYRKFGEKPSPKTCLDPPPTMRFPPPFWRLSVISLKRKRHRPDQLRFLRLQKWFGEHTLQYVSPPPNSRDTFCPPPSAAAQYSRFFPCSKCWSKRRQALGPQSATMDANRLSLSAWAWRLLCDKQKWNQVPTWARPLGRCSFLFAQILLCSCLPDSGTPTF